ncbi:MAG: hypothetical protein KBH94_06280 [Caldisericia bacterium]|nr:hypothetical protein [Caldisericia bacterium]
MKNSIKDIFSNPFSQESSLEHFDKQIAVLGEILSIKGLSKKVISLLILAILGVLYLKIPTPIIVIIFGVEILFLLISGYFKLEKAKSILKIDTQEGPKAYLTRLITSTKYNAKISTFGTLASIVSVSLVLTFFSEEISNFVLEIFPYPANILKLLLFIFIGFKLFKLLLELLKYQWVKNIQNKDDYAMINQDYQIIQKKLDLINLAVTMSSILLVLYLINIPFYIPLIFTGFFVILIVSSIIELRRIKEINLVNPLKENNSKKSSPVKINKDEEIILPIFGIMKTSVDLKSALEPFGISFLGKGKVLSPENSLLITNKRLLFIQVPMTGGDNIVGETNYVTNNFFYNKKELLTNGEELLRTQSLPQILQLVKKEISYEEIKTVILKENKLIIEKTSGEKFGYFFMEKEYLNIIKETLIQFLGDKLIV